jgi:hypothetical protein
MVPGVSVPSTSPSPRWIPAATLLALAGVGAGLALGFGLTASDATERFAMTNDVALKARLSAEARTWALGSDISLGAGVASLAIGVVLLLLNAPAEPAKSTTAWLTPTGTGVAAGLTW